MVFLVVPLFVLAGVFVVVGLATANQATSSALVSWVVNTLRFVPVFGVTLAEVTLQLSRWVAHKLGELADPLVEMAVQWVSSLRLVTIGLWVSGLEAPVEAFRITSALVWHFIPNAIKDATLSTVKTVTKVVPVVVQMPGKVVKAAAVTQAQIVRAINAAWPALTHGYLDSWNWLRRHERAIAAAIAATAGGLTLPGIATHGLPIPFGQTVKQIRRRLRALELRSVGLAFAGAVAVALTRLGLHWLKCDNVKKFGRQVCQTPWSALERLLAGLVIVYGVVNIRVLARETYDLMTLGAKEVQKFWGGGVGGIDTNPGLGDVGSVAFLNTAASGAGANPGLGDIA